jgi:hypothetical protein
MYEYARRPMKTMTREIRTKKEADVGADLIAW